MSQRPELPVHLGWRLQDPGPAPRSRHLDDVPSSCDAAIQQRWRQTVEADEGRLRRQHAQAPLWYPVISQDIGPVVPLYGGSARTRIGAVVTVVGTLFQRGTRKIVLLDVENSGLVDRLQSAKNLRWGGAVRILSPRGSDLDVLKAVTVSDLASLVVDVLPADSPFEAGRVKQRLMDIAKAINEPKSLERLQQAVRFALTGQPPRGANFRPDEEDRLLDYHSVEVQNRRDLEHTLDRLADDLSLIAQYGPRPGGVNPVTFGSSNQACTVLTVDDSTGMQDFRIGKELLTRYLAREKQRRSGRNAPPSPLLVLGASELAPETLTSLVRSAERDNFPLLLFFDRLAEGPGKALLGTGGQANAVFFNLGSPEDRQRAAEFLGREFKFVVNGHTITQGSSEEWSSTTTIGSDATTSRAWTFGAGFGSTVTRGISQSRSQATVSGGGINYSAAQSTQRVHEFVVEPDEFKRIPDYAALVIQGDEAVLTFCDPGIRRNPLAIAYP